MKLYQSVGPNPRVVLMYVAAKGISIERQFIDLLAGENRRAPFTDLNPFGQTPLLVLDDGSSISESVAICEYLEELHPEPALIGTTPEARAVVRMLIRRIDSDVVAPMGTAFRSSEGLPMFKNRLRCVPEGADTLKACARDGMARFDAWLAEREWLAGDRFSLADILLFCFLEFGATVGQPMPAELSHLAAWRERVAAHPSAACSANPKDGL